MDDRQALALCFSDDGSDQRSRDARFIENMKADIRKLLALANRSNRALSISQPVEPQVLQEMKLRCRGATPPPWRVSPERDRDPIIYAGQQNKVAVISRYRATEEACLNTAIFIAHARENLDCLIAYILEKMGEQQ